MVFWDRDRILAIKSSTFFLLRRRVLSAVGDSSNIVCLRSYKARSFSLWVRRNDKLREIILHALLPYPLIQRLDAIANFSVTFVFSNYVAIKAVIKDEYFVGHLK